MLCHRWMENGDLSEMRSDCASAMEYKSRWYPASVKEIVRPDTFTTT
jgi:hypothetical protein